MFNRALSFLFLASAFNNADAFVYTASSSRSWGLNAINPKSAFSFAKKAAKVKSMADLIGKDKDGNVVRVPVKNIEREWSDGDFKAYGEFSVDLFLPEEKKKLRAALFSCMGSLNTLSLIARLCQKHAKQPVLLLLPSRLV